MNTTTITTAKVHGQQRVSLGIAALAAAALMGLAGCSTPQPARDLASQGAAMTDKAQSETLAFVDRANRAYQRREAILRELSEGEIRDTSAGDFRAWIDEQAGTSVSQDRIALITRIAERSRSTRESLAAALAARQKEITEASAANVAEVPGQKLGATKKAFINLAQEMTPEEWLKFSVSYVQQVQRDLKALQAPAPSAPAASSAGSN